LLSREECAISEEHAYEQLVAKTRAGIAGGADEELWKTRIVALLRAGLARGEVTVTGSLIRPDVGASSGNLLFSARFNDGSGDRQHDLVLRYQPADGLMNRYDMGAQFRVQRVLADAGVKVARPLCLDLDGSLLGTPGYIMRRAVGVAPRQYYYAQGPMAEVDTVTRQALIAEIMETLARIHAFDWRAAGLNTLSGGSAPEKSIGGEIIYYTDALRFASVEIADSLSGYERWLHENQPRVRNPVLNHGDYQPSNMLFADGKLVVVLDWETARITAPESDLGWLMGVHSFARILGGTNNIADMPSDADWLTAYERASGRSLQHWEYHLAKGTFCTLIVLHVFGRRMSAEEFKPFAGILAAQEDRMRTLFKAAGATL
jgi:aminoglycoside phosphotransferase (APT) family kinase protein